MVQWLTTIQLNFRHKSFLSNRPASSRVPLRPSSSSKQATCTPEGGFTCNSCLVSRIRLTNSSGKRMRDKGEVVWEYVCVTCRLRLVPSCCQCLQKTVLLQCGNLDNDQTKDYLTCKGNWTTLVKVRYWKGKLTTGRDLSCVLPLVWSLTLWPIISPFMTWKEKKGLNSFLIYLDNLLEKKITANERETNVPSMRSVFFCTHRLMVGVSIGDLL